jgi:hypothetical protein
MPPDYSTKSRNSFFDKNLDEAVRICSSGGKRALPQVLCAGIKKAQVEPHLVAGAMGEESTHIAAHMERRLSLLIAFGNVSTLLGLLGTVFGLIMSFAAVGTSGVSRLWKKSAMLASGISAAMNSTLVGLSISIPCVMVYSYLRFRVDAALVEVDRFAIAILNQLNPPEITDKKTELPCASKRRRRICRHRCHAHVETLWSCSFRFCCRLPNLSRWAP